jgi:hypothetical protein
VAKLRAAWNWFYRRPSAAENGYRAEMAIHRQPRHELPIEKHNPEIDRYRNQWVATLNGKIVAAAASAKELADRLGELGLRGKARAEFVPEPVDGYKVGLG